MKNETTVVLSKVPDEWEHSWAIKTFVSCSLQNLGFYHKRGPVKLREPDINAIWSNVPLNVRCALLEKLSGRVITAWLIEGDGVVQKIRELRGLDTDPEKCRLGSWRRDLVSMLSVRHVRLPRIGTTPAIRTFDNFVHVPDEASVQKDLRILARFFR